MGPHPGPVNGVQLPPRVGPVQSRDGGPERVQLLPHAGVAHQVQGGSPGLPLLGGVAAQILTQARAKTEMKPKDGIHAVAVFRGHAPVQDKHSGGFRPVISRLEIKQEIPSETTPPLHRV